MEQILTAFFESHPTTNEVYEALGKLFLEKEKAEAFLAGVAGHVVVCHSRDGIVFDKKSDELFHEILKQTNVINGQQLIYESAAPQDKESAMNTWKAEKLKLEKLEHEWRKQLQDEKKDAGSGKKEVEKTEAEETEVEKTEVENTEVEETGAEEIEVKPEPKKSSGKKK